MVGFEEGKRRLPSWQYAASGAAAGIITRALAQPLDVVKIRLQLQVEPVSKKSLESKYKSSTHAAVSILRQEGLAALWKGHNPGQLLSLSYGLVQFSTFEMVSTSAAKFGWTGGTADMVCGAFAGGMATFVSFPLDVIRTRFIAQPAHAEVFLTMMDAARKTVSKEGVTALWRGLTPTIIQASPHAAVQFSAFRRFSQLAKSSGFASKDGKLGVMGDLVCGGAAGAVAKTVVYPFDLARKRLQLQGFQFARVGFGQNIICSGMVDCLWKTFKGEGLAGLYKGLSASILKAVVTTALHFSAYHQVVALFQSIQKT